MRTLSYVLIGLLLVPSAAADWPMFRSDELHTGRSTDSAQFAPYEDVWWTDKAPGKAFVEASPVVSEGNVIVADWNGVVRALDLESGAQKWQYNFTFRDGSGLHPDKVVATPAVSGGRVFVVGASGTLRALGLDNGQVLAEAKVGATLATPTVHEGKLFLGNEEGLMQAFDTQTLTKLWSVSTIVGGMVQTSNVDGSSSCVYSSAYTPKAVPAGAIRGAPAVYGQRVFFGALNNYVYAVSELGNPDKSTNVMWVNATKDIVWSSPTVIPATGSSSALVVFGSYDEQLHAYNTIYVGDGPRPVKILNGGATACWSTNVTQVWSKSFQDQSNIGRSKIHSSPATDGDGNVYVGTNSGRVVSVTRTGQDRSGGWNTTTGLTNDLVVSSPAIAGKSLVVGSDDRNVYFLNLTTGAVAKKFSAAGQIKSSPAVIGDRVVVSSFEGTTYMLGPKRPPTADLRVDSISYANGIVRVSLTNAGDASSVACILRLESDGLFLLDVNVDPLAPNQQKAIDASPTLAAGLHKLHAYVDQTNVVNERDDANNHGYYNVTIVGEAATSTASTSSEEDGGSFLPANGLFAVMTGLGVAVFVARRKQDEA